MSSALPLFDPWAPQQGSQSIAQNLSQNPSFTWKEALHEFRLHLRVTRALKTLHYYDVQLGGLARWSNENAVPLVGRAEAGRAPLTLRHDAVCAKAFFRWCQRNDVIERGLLATQQIAGHKETRTTLLYTQLDPDFVRGVHDSVGVVSGVLENRRALKQRKRLV